MAQATDMLLYSVLAPSFAEITLHMHMHRELEGNTLTQTSSWPRQINPWMGVACFKFNGDGRRSPPASAAPMLQV
jgi:hypothetical protein